jgi:hypothetical protein
VAGIENSHWLADQFFCGITGGSELSLVGVGNLAIDIRDHNAETVLIKYAAWQLVR